MKNSSINQINHFDTTFGRINFSTEGSFEKGNAGTYFRAVQNRISTRNY